MQSPDTSELLEAACKVLPPEAVQAIQSLPADQQLEALQRLLQQSEITFGPLSAKHAKYIKRRCKDYGFLEGTLDLSRLGKDNCIAFGSFEAPDQPVAFLLAEVHPSSKSPVLSQKQTAAALDALISSPGTTQTGAAVVTLTALGVSYQYRRQGLASQLLGYLQEVAAQLGAVAVLLMVLKANEGAAAFYAAAGYKDSGLSVDKDNVCYKVFGLPLQQQQQQQGESEEDVAVFSGAGGVQAQPAASSSMSKPAGSSRGFGGGGGAKKGRRKARAVGCMASACNQAPAITPTCSSSSSSGRRCPPGWQPGQPWGLPSKCSSSRCPQHMARTPVTHVQAPVHRPAAMRPSIPPGVRLGQVPRVLSSRQGMPLSVLAAIQWRGHTVSSRTTQRQAMLRWV